MHKFDEENICKKNSFQPHSNYILYVLQMVSVTRFFKAIFICDRQKKSDNGYDLAENEMMEYQFGSFWISCSF